MRYDCSIEHDMTEQRPSIFDRALHLRRLARRRGPADDALAPIANSLAERLAEITRRFDDALVISPHASLFTARIAASGRAARLTAIAPPADDDLRLAPASCDAIFDLLDLHAVNDVPGRLAQISRALRPDGLYLACFFGGETLAELRQAWIEAELEEGGRVSPRVAPMIDIRSAGALLQRAGLALPVADMDRARLRYPDALSLMREISHLGMSNILRDRARTPATRRLVLAAASHYRNRNADGDGRVVATLELIWLTAWSPHESQPKPLKPGSAERRLADALGAEETRFKADRSDKE